MTIADTYKLMEPYFGPKLFYSLPSAQQEKALKYFL